MKIAITGAQGMLGQEIQAELNKNPSNEVKSYSKNDLDITQEKEVEKLKEFEPSVIINCAAYTQVDKAESDKETCLAINFLGVKQLTDYCSKQNCTLVHFSTDYVFNGDKKGYLEEDTKQPLNYYGETKSQGEDYILNHLSSFFIIRTSWLFGKHGGNFVKTMVSLMKEKDDIHVVDDQEGSPTYAVDLARKTISLLEEEKPEYGIYHVTNKGSCTWFDYACFIKKQIQAQCQIHPCDSSQFPKPAKRPRFSVLVNTKTEELPLWEDAVNRYLLEEEFITSPRE